MLKKHFAQLFEEYSLPQDPAGKDSNSCVLILSDTLQIEMKDLQPGLSLKTQIGTVLENDKEDFFIFVMKANFLHQGTGEGVIGVEKDEKHLTLCADFPYEMDYASFKEKIETHANYTEFWQQEIAKWQEQRQKL